MEFLLFFTDVDHKNKPDPKHPKEPKPHPWESGTDVLDGMKNYFYVDTLDASKILFFYVLWNIVSIQFGKVHQRFNSINTVKTKRVSESVWRCLYQAAMVLYGAYNVLSGPENLVLQPSVAWQSWGDSEQLSDYLQIFFLMQLSFHIYSVTYLLKEARKEHHAYSFLTLHTLQFIMIALFYTLHYYQVGLLVCLFYDVPGLAIEITRINVYLEKLVSIFRYFSYMSFSIYTLLWLCNTLYLYPTKVLYFGVVSTMERVDRPLVETVTFGLILLQLFNLYWLLILLQWMKKMIKHKRTKDYFVVYSFFHKRGLQKSTKDRSVNSEDEKPKNESRALIQTVKCVIRLKRKLNRIRAEKLSEEGEPAPPVPEQQSFEIELNPHDTLMIGLLGQKELEDDENKKKDSKSEVKEDEGQKGDMQVKSSNELIKFSSFTSGEDSKSSSDLSLKEV